MTPFVRTDGPIGGHLPSTEKPGPYRIVRFRSDNRPEPEDNWRNHAACRDEDGDLFFPVGTGAAAERATAEAKAICAGCEVISDCAAFLKHMQTTLPGAVDGVWAGTSTADREREQRRIRSERDRARAKAKKQAAA